MRPQVTDKHGAIHRSFNDLIFSIKVSHIYHGGLCEKGYALNEKEWSGMQAAKMRFLRSCLGKIGRALVIKEKLDRLSYGSMTVSKEWRRAGCQ